MLERSGTSYTSDKTMKNTELELANQSSRALSRQAPSPADMMQAMIEKGVTAENVAAFKELVVLSEHMEDRSAKREFIQAYTLLQSEIPTIKAVHAVPDKSGGTKFYVARFDEIDDQVRPLCLRYGFSYTFNTLPVENGRQTAIFTLMHKAGHCRDFQYSVRIGAGPPGATESQADGSAISYAKRGAMCAGLSIMVDRDCDPRDLGDTSKHVTPEQAEELERRAKETNSIIPALLKFAGAKSFAEIPAMKYDALDQLLRKKEQQGR